MNARTLEDAMALWEGTGTAVVETARAVSGLLAEHGIPALTAGGVAVQLHGYPRYTVDVDLIVADVSEAHRFLLGHGYSDYALRPFTVIDPERRVRIDLLPAGRCLKSVCEVPFPAPEIPAVLQPVSLEMLLSLKLDSWKHTPMRRMRDKADVTELIIRNDLPRDLKVHPAVSKDYLELWDAIAAEPPGPVA